MIEGVGWLEDLRRTAVQDASVPALRALLFLCGALGAFAWLRRRPLAAWSLFTLGGLLGLGYWLIQIVVPFGFGTDAALTGDWAQTGVNAFAEPGQGGFVWGTGAESSLLSRLATSRVPFGILVSVPQLATVTGLILVAFLPFALMRNRTTAAFAASLGLCGGLWPGIFPYASILWRPSGLMAAGLLAFSAMILVRRPRVRATLRRARFRLLAAAIVFTTLARALGGSTGREGFADLLLIGTVFVLASPVRAVLRAGRSGNRTRLIEAALLLVTFCGSGLLWWDPPRSVAGFERARNGSPALLKPMSWINENVTASGVILASPHYSAPIAAFGGRRVLFPPATSPGAAGPGPLPEPFRRARLVEWTQLGQPPTRLAQAFSVTHLFLGPGEPNPAGGSKSLVPAEPTMELRLVYQDAEDFRIFELVKK